MDEGFTEYICTMAEVDVMNVDEQKYFERAYKRYVRYALSGFEQPQSTHADHEYTLLIAPLLIQKALFS